MRRRSRGKLSTSLKKSATDTSTKQAISRKKYAQQQPLICNYLMEILPECINFYTCHGFFCALQVLQHMEDVKIREMQIFDYKKKIAESETKLKQQQNLYEAVRSDRNLYSKNLIESQVSQSDVH